MSMNNNLANQKRIYVINININYYY